MATVEHRAVQSHVIGHVVGGSATAVAPGQDPDEAPWLTTVPWLSGFDACVEQLSWLIQDPNEGVRDPNEGGLVHIRLWWNDLSVFK